MLPPVPPRQSGNDRASLARVGGGDASVQGTFVDAGPGDVHVLRRENRDVPLERPASPGLARCPGVPCQDDYLFASPAVAERLRRCLAFNPTEWYAFSDHSPIVATFED